jgi:hypothetical protein
MVGVRGFEPPTPASRTQYSTRLSYTPIQKTNVRLRLDAPTKLGSGAPSVQMYPSGILRNCFASTHAQVA